MTATLWQKGWLYAVDPVGGDAVAAMLTATGLTGAILKLSIDPADIDRDGARTAEQYEAWAQKIRAAGKLAGAWFVPTPDAGRSANLVYGFWHDGARPVVLLVDAENGPEGDRYCYTGRYGVEFGPAREEVVARNLTLIAKLHSHFPRLPTGWNILGNAGADYSGRAHAAAKAAGWRLVPQVYLNDDAVLDPAAQVQAFVTLHSWPRSLIHPAIGLYEGQRGHVDGATWVKRLSAAWTKGYFGFRAETARTTDLAVLGSAQGIVS